MHDAEPERNDAPSRPPILRTVSLLIVWISASAALWFAISGGAPVPLLGADGAVRAVALVTSATGFIAAVAVWRASALMLPAYALWAFMLIAFGYVFSSHLPEEMFSDQWMTRGQWTVASLLFLAVLSLLLAAGAQVLRRNSRAP